jgi:hypothetical protein
MEVVNLDKPDVLIIKNFISKDEVELILNFLKNCDEDSWMVEYNQLLNKKSNDSYKKDPWEGMTIPITNKNFSKKFFPNLPAELVYRLSDQIKDVTEKRFKENLVIQLSGLHRWRPGREQKPHIDYFLDEEEHDFSLLESYNITKDHIDSFKENFNDKHYSSILYLNNNYSGGELYMPQHNFEVKPEPGMLVCFKGDENNLHGVKMVTEGIRYTMSIFWTRKEWLEKRKFGGK